MVSNDIGNRVSTVVTVVALTTRIPPRRYPFQVVVAPSEANGLVVPSVVMGNQLLTVDRERLLERMGRLMPDQMGQVNRALRVSLDL